MDQKRVGVQQGGLSMVKATLRSAVLLGLLVWSVPSFAEVQNVKVGGDITARGFWRSHLNLQDDNGALGSGHQDFFMTTTGINIGADLTENVSTFIRLANERDWNTGTVGAAGTNSGDFAVSQAYVTLKELFYSPLTLRIGAQPIVWGRGFVLGSNLIPGTVNRAGDLHNSITANEFTDFTAFDAIRATLDLSGVGGMGIPLTADYVYIKLQENSVGVNDDVNLQGINLGTHFDALSSEVETYFLNKRDNSAGQTLTTPVSHNAGSVNTLGIRGSIKPLEGSYVYGELAYQFGQRAADPAGLQIAGGGQQAWAFDLGAEYTAKEIPMTPKLGAEWIFFSGKDENGAVGGWDPIARGYFTTALRDFQTGSTVTGFYPNAQTCFTSGAAGNPCTGAYTNQHEFSVYGSFKPLQDLTIAPRLSWFFLDVGAIPVAGSKRRSFAGTEWDTVATYNYTDDVQFGLIYGLFAPGNVYRNPQDNVAQELVSSVSVKF